MIRMKLAAYSPQSILLTLTVCFLSINAIAQKPTPTPKLPREIEISYDKFKDQTRVSGGFYAEIKGTGFTTGGWGPDVKLVYSYPGESLSSDEQDFMLIFMRELRSSYCFHEDDELIFLIDGDRLKKDHPIMSRPVDDSIGFAVTRDEIMRLAGAHNVEFQVGCMTSALRAKELPRFKTLLDLGTKPK